MTSGKNRRSSDQPSWEKVATNIVLVGSAVAAVLMGIRVVGGYYVEQEKLRVIERTVDSLTKNIQLLSIRFEETKREVDRRSHRILDNEREIERLRNKSKFRK